ncbi:hypothetical protein BDF20DRAFT_895425 [Mycotypha africana]|uniref:uncharacterized protein n=1 Tax=Mycotypha africana TaxID=64632 RepID=UPI00230117AF|nr:uncharacterized protein BDF20DRAFT_895425 [Mycotypha africana]KAI8968288.1 hypothetical protein BDF20DRAFT_895425 [Mycotypha africana]
MDQGSNEKHILLQGELSCTICTHTFEDPHVLNCGHSYCGGCILEWLKANKICPLCRTPVNRRPIHIIALQKMADVIRTEEVVAERKLNAEDWIKLFPHDNQSSYIIDEDDDGIVHRCSRCGWELDEDNFCARCEIQFDGSYDPEVDIPRTRGRPAFSNTQEEPIEVASDSDNDYEDNRDLEGFVVDDDHVEYEDLDDGLTTDDTDREERSPSEHISISSTESDSDEDAEQMRHNDGDDESRNIPFDEVSSNNSANSSNNIEVDNSDYDIGSDDDASHGSYYCY